MPRRPSPRRTLISASLALPLLLPFFALLTGTGPTLAATPLPPSRLVRTPGKADMPAWKVGYRWEYDWKRPGSSGTYTKEIVREDAFEGVPTFVAKALQTEEFYTKDTLGLLATVSKGKPGSAQRPPFQFFVWPLEVGGEWRTASEGDSPEDESSSGLMLVMRVAGLEEVSVSAGTFEAFRVEMYEAYSGLLIMEYWYSPKVKWMVKARQHWPNTVYEEELRSFKVD